MTRRTTKISVLRTISLHCNRESARRFATRGPTGKLALLLLLLAVAGGARAQSGHTYYVDYATGSNANAGTKLSPWKSHPYMQHASGCTGGNTTWPGWSHAAGDQYIFKGGVTWPAACLALVITQGGSSASTVSGAGVAPTINGADYYGVDVTWFAGGSFTRPVFDAAGDTPDGPDFGAIIVDNGANYVTFDDIETKNNLLTGNNQTGCSMDLTGPTGITVDRMYVHDWTMASPELNADHFSGSICSKNGQTVSIYNTEISDAGTTAPHPFGACFVFSYEVAYNNCHDTAEGGLFTHGPFHDNEIVNLDGTVAYSGACGTNCVHSNAYEADDGPAPALYNNYFFNDDVGFNVICPGTAFYNNVISGVFNSGAGSINGEISIDTDCAFADSSTQTFVYNNTIDTTQPGSGSCVTIVTRNPPARTSSGLVTLENNFCIGSGFNLSGATVTPVQSNNPNVSSSTANAQGYTAANKYAPTSGTGATINAGVNFTPSCSSALAFLCQDASGAVWFGGSSKTRPTGSAAWDAGSYEYQGGAGGGPPSVSISAPTNSATVSGSTNLTASCTPQGSATLGSIQFQIDGTSFGSAGTSSPYTLSWNTLTAANASHTISATCTDSNSQTGTASTVTVTVSNSMPGCFVSGSNTNWNSYQPFSAQSTNFTATFTATPNTSNQDSVIALSESPMTAYSQGAALVRFNSSGHIDVYKGSLGDYTADATVGYAAGVTYSFTFTVNMAAGTYTVALTSPTSLTLATGYTFRTTAPAASLGYINAVSDDTTPDTAEICNFQIGSAASLSFSPASLNFGNVTVGANSTQTITATTVGGSVNFSSLAIGGNADFTVNSNTCTGSVPSSCTTQIKFAPTSAALETATVTFTDDATGSPHSVAVGGTGVPATPTLSVSPASVNFGGVQVHATSSSGPIVLTISSGPVTFTGTPSLSGANAADFALASNSCTGTVSAASCQSVVSFTPSALAAESATLSYTDNATGSPQSVALTGTGYLAPHPPTAVHATVQ